MQVDVLDLGPVDRGTSGAEVAPSLASLRLELLPAASLCFSASRKCDMRSCCLASSLAFCRSAFNKRDLWSSNKAGSRTMMVLMAEAVCEGNGAGPMDRWTNRQGGQ